MSVERLGNLKQPMRLNEQLNSTEGRQQLENIRNTGTMSRPLQKAIARRSFAARKKGEYIFIDFKV